MLFSYLYSSCTARPQQCVFLQEDEAKQMEKSDRDFATRVDYLYHLTGEVAQAVTLIEVQPYIIFSIIVL